MTEDKFIKKKTGPHHGLKGIRGSYKCPNKIQKYKKDQV